MTARRVAWLAAAVLAAGPVVGCALEPDVGPPLPGGTCNDADSNPRMSVSFASNIRPLIVRTGGGGCGCHLPSSDGPGTGTQLAGLDLSSLQTLKAGGFNSSNRTAIAGQPCESIMYQKLSDSPPFGSRMPLNGPPFWTSDELQLLHDWIAEGAGDN